MQSINRVTLIGYLGSEPKISLTSAGEKIANLSVATSESWKDKGTGEKKERTEWHRIVIFIPSLAEFAEKYLKKGSRVFIEGQLQTHKYTDKENIERSITEIVLQPYNGNLILLDSKQDPFTSTENYPIEDKDFMPF